jgi:hypothetical protein
VSEETGGRHIFCLQQIGAAIARSKKAGAG